AMINEDREDSDAAQCFSILMTRHVDHWHRGSKSTITRLLQGGLDDGGIEYRDTLLSHGLRLRRENGEWVLFVASRHEGLKAIFQNTRWREGAWKQALARLDGASMWPDPVRFHGHQSRAVAIPRKHLPVREDGDA